ncbi:MAG: carboxylating nicotinate-nucleotide diphosphorylase [Candidatus Natronoplasma sp.]
MNAIEIEEVIKRAIDEDIGSGDITTENIIEGDKKGEGVMIAKEKGVVAGLEVAEKVFEMIDKSLKFEAKKDDGEEVKKGEILAVIRGDIESILKAERLALNFLQRMSGIATKTRRYVDKVRGYDVRVTDTRKTTPTLRYFEKWAVRLGGGHNHRMGLYDAVLIKDNHIKSAGGIGEAIGRILEKIPHTTKIEVEVESISGVKEALKNKADIIMLDNMSLEIMEKSVELIGDSAVTEASGGITLENIEEVAKTGVDVISVGALTHHIESIDIGLDIKN